MSVKLIGTLVRIFLLAMHIKRGSVRFVASCQSFKLLDIFVGKSLFRYRLTIRFRPSHFGGLHCSILDPTVSRCQSHAQTLLQHKERLVG